MQIIINGKPAAIKAGTSFEYISENPLFSGSESYTLSITFPLAGCPGNIEIFGNICRPEIPVERRILDCEIRHGSRIHCGTLVIVDITDKDVKCQFLEGRSEQNFSSTFDKIYINELELGEPSVFDPASISPEHAWNPALSSYESVALPWVSADSGVSHNFADVSPESGKFSWSDTRTHLSWQPYLLFITKKICEAIGYEHSLAPWEQEKSLSKILICNTLPSAWDIPQYARALPHWTVEEYFEKLGLFLAGEFTIDHRLRKISFAFTRDIISGTPPVSLDSVLDTHTANIDTDSQKCEYIGARNLAYKDTGHQMSKYYSCQWYIDTIEPVVYPDIISLLNDNKSCFVWDGFNHRGSNLNRLLYAADLGLHFIFRAVSRELVQSRPEPLGDIYSYKCLLQPVNEFGDRIVSPADDADTDEIEFIPACIDYTDSSHGMCLFLGFGSYSEDSAYTGLPMSSEEAKKQANEFRKPSAQQMIEAGEKNKQSEYYSEIYVAWYGGFESGPMQACPAVSAILFNYDAHHVSRLGFSLRLNDSEGIRRRECPAIDTTHKATFKFLADDIPSARAVFHIKGRRYICEKITATFTESGMSRLLKGEFWPLLD